MVGTNIKILLEHKRMTPSHLARHCGVSAQAALNWKAHT